MDHLRRYDNVEAPLPKGQRCGRGGYVGALRVQAERRETGVEIGDLASPISSHRPGFERGSERTITGSKVENGQRSVVCLAQYLGQKSLEWLGEGKKSV